MYRLDVGGVPAVIAQELAATANQLGQGPVTDFLPGPEGFQQFPPGQGFRIAFQQQQDELEHPVFHLQQFAIPVEKLFVRVQPEFVELVDHEAPWRSLVLVFFLAL